MSSTKTKVAIVGAGVAGLVMTRHITSKLNIYSLTVFERTDQIGGTWVYTDETHFDKHGLLVQRSMYKNLRTNLPKEVMQIPDFPFKDQDGPSFIHHSIVKQYLLDYADHFNLYPYIKLNTLVKHVEPEVRTNGPTLWTLTYVDLETKVETTRSYDAVLLCNGRNTTGYVPHIPGIESFHNDCIHSHQYRLPEVYAGKKVCILGASWSGIDIALEIEQYVDKVYLSHNLPKLIDFNTSVNIEQRAGVASIQGNLFTFLDGSSTKVDSLIYCTGYKLVYPFMSTKIKIYIDKDYIEPIYKYVTHMDYTNLFFLGLPANVTSFPMFHIQAQYILGILEGRIKLPSSQQMREEYESKKKSLIDQGIPIKQHNKLNDRQWAYYNEIAAAVNVPSLPPVMRKIIDHVNEMRNINITGYKNYKYHIIDSENFSVLL